MTVSTIDYGRTVHYARNIIGRVTYGLIGLDKILQNDKIDSETYISSFLSLFGPLDQPSSGETHRLLPEVEGKIDAYGPQLKEELLSVAESVRKIAKTNADKGEVEKVYNQLEDLLNKLYETTSAMSKTHLYD